ncbi:MAG: hypothetical protein ACRD4L_15085, partial [Pyrinomonadaceae bacterium]
NLVRLAFLSSVWQSKWVLLPLSIFVVWASWRIGKKVIRDQKSCFKPRLALWVACALATLGIFTTGMIGMMIPEQLRLIQVSRDAGRAALLYTSNRLLLEYRDKYGTYPGMLSDLTRLPAQDGAMKDSAVSRVLAEFDPNGYKPTSFQARLPNKGKSASLRGMSLRQISVTTPPESSIEEGFSFTNYELVWPGEDHILGTADDRAIRDGQIVTLPSRRQ